MFYLQVKVTVSPESAVAQYGGVPWWIILIAVLAGILILALLVFLLWKVSSRKLQPHIICVKMRRQGGRMKGGT